MSNTTLLFVGIGIVIAIIGACIFQFNRGADERTRQTGLVFFAGSMKPHFVPQGNPAPPRPRRPEALTSLTMSGPRMVRAFFSS